MSNIRTNDASSGIEGVQIDTQATMSAEARKSTQITYHELQNHPVT